MKPFLGVFLVLAWLPGSAWSADERAIAVIDKAIAAMGGQERFEKAKTTYLACTIDEGLVNGVQRTTARQVTVQGLENFRSVSASADKTTIVVINGDQAWLQAGRGTLEMPAHGIGRWRQGVLAWQLPTRPDLLKSRVFDLEWAGEQFVEGRPAVAVKVNGPDIISMKIYFDKELGLPIKQEAQQSAEKQDTIVEILFTDYKEFDGIKVATLRKVAARPKAARGIRISQVERVTTFKILDKIPPETFTEPK